MDLSGLEQPNSFMPSLSKREVLIVDAIPRTLPQAHSSQGAQGRQRRK